MLKYLKVKTILVCVGLCVLASGCVTTQSVQKSSGPKTQIYVIEGDKQMPDWVDKADAKSTKTQKAFSGESRKHATRVDAKNAAELDAKQKAVDSLYGELIDKTAKDIFVEAGVTTEALAGEVAQKMKRERSSAGLIRGDFVDYCVQRVEETDASGSTQTYWRAYALYLVDRNIAKETLQEILNGEKNKASTKESMEKIERGLKLLDKITQEW